MHHRLEPSPSGRARCRACLSALPKGELRFAESVPNPVGDGTTYHFYHPRCAAERRPEAYLMLDAELASGPGPELREGGEALRRVAQEATEHPRLSRLGELSAAPTGRATCRHCNAKIEKATWRVALQPIEEGRLQAWGFLHVKCAAGYVGAPVGEQRLLRYSNLPADALQSVREALVPA